VNRLHMLRERLHMYPEQGMKEFKTKEELRHFVDALPSGKLEMIEVMETGLLYVYKNSDNPFTLLRADMDGLPLKEKTGVDYQSRTEGWMHACGHDVHMAVLAGVIARVTETEIPVNALFLFQPAEEGPGGAEPILKSGILDNFEISSALALHVNPAFRTGTISSTPGPIFGNATEFDAIFEGKEAHGAFPHSGRDALLPASDFVKTGYEMLSRVIPADQQFVFTIGRLLSGSRRNVVPGRAVVEGTFRALREETKRKIMKTIEELTANLGSLWNVEARTQYGSMYPVVNNDPAIVTLIEETANRLGYDYAVCQTTFTGEDFGFFSQRYPSALFWLGCSDPESHEGLHSPSFLPDPECIDVGVDVMFDFLRKASEHT